MTRHDLQLAEYDAVFAEVRQSITLQYSAIGVGIAFFGVLLREVVASYSQQKWLLCFFLSSCLPVIAVFALFVWLGEVARMRRGAVYLARLEETLNRNHPSATGNDLYGFHSWGLRSAPRIHLKAHYAAILIFFSMAGTLGLALAAYCSFLHPWKRYLLASDGTFAIFFFAALIFLAIRAVRINRWTVEPPFSKRLELE
jgi:hypothetical protein